MIRIVACFIVGSFFTLWAEAQIKPGKEKIVVNLPTDYRWKSNKIPKDTKGIRGTAYTIRGSAADDAAVKQVTVTTIDRRYYPMKAEGSPEEKWIYEKSGCPEATLEVVDKKVVDGRTAILYAIKSTKMPDAACGSANLITYVVEGPTALHTVELTIPEAQFTPETYRKWCDALLQSHIE
ncbi:hypothetical protein [Parapedobacter sp. 10938]|uniref:hypothetical protein n=1 Tax=Parapedobacter flavus TaxID=3110225 RepID=UPI002DB7DEA4|nr:hypothetical protein [Parapedobacter sp. 10938]MEC3878747.1 hypothetical protein [Parapedobacter sp. 10938]